MSQLIYLNPESIIISQNVNEIVLSINSNNYRLSGPKMKKYFIDFFIYFIAPISIDNLSEIINDRLDCLSKKDFLMVINILSRSGIIIKYLENTNLKKYKAKTLIIDYSNLIVNNHFTKEFIKQVIDKNLGIDIEIINGFLINDYDSISNYEVVIPVLWSWHEVYINNFIELIKSSKLLLPIIKNDNCFIIGPQINNTKSSLNDFLYNARMNKHRYSKINYFNKYDRNNLVLMSFLSNELLEIYNYLFSNYISYSRTKNRSIYFDFSMSILENSEIKYINLNNERKF